MPSFEATQRGYSNLWASMTVRPEKREIAETIARKLSGQKSRYDAVSDRTGVPWWWIAITHQLEAGGSFRGHLHNGDPLTARTRQVPAGRPREGSPPFTWEFSAEDALRMHDLDAIRDWSVARALYEFERYNGWGYVPRKINSPYLWSYSTHYTRGKYVADGRFDASAVSSQCGAAVLLRVMLDLGIARIEAAQIPPHPAPAKADRSVLQIIIDGLRKGLSSRS